MNNVSGHVVVYADASLMAIPFFHNTIAGDLVWTGLIFGTYLALRNYSNLQIFKQKNTLIFN